MKFSHVLIGKENNGNISVIDSRVYELKSRIILCPISYSAQYGVIIDIMLIWRGPSISQTVTSKFPGVLMKRSNNQTQTDNDKPHALAVHVQHSVIAYSFCISYVSQLFIPSNHCLIWYY